MLVQESVTHDELMRVIWQAPVQGVLRHAELFDIYHPDRTQEKSMAIRLSLNAEDRALTEVEIENAVASVVRGLSDKLGARQRA